MTESNLRDLHSSAIGGTAFLRAPEVNESNPNQRGDPKRRQQMQLESLHRQPKGRGGEGHPERGFGTCENLPLPKESQHETRARVCLPTWDAATAARMMMDLPDLRNLHAAARMMSRLPSAFSFKPNL